MGPAGGADLVSELLHYRAPLTRVLKLDPDEGMDEKAKGVFTD
jgi:hypothetical protein